MNISLTAVCILLVGLTARAETTSNYPEIVSFFSQVSFDGKTENAGRCTGTFIHPRLLLTASHCVRHFNASKMNGRVVRATDMSDRPVADQTADASQTFISGAAWWGITEIHPVRVTVSDLAIPVERGDLSLDYVEQDLAIVEFAQEFQGEVRHVAQRAPSIGDPVLMIGFGRHAGTTATKHFGRNTMSMIELDMLATNGSAKACTDPEKVPNNWAICGGDSGGPLLDARTGEILGVASASVEFKKDDRLGREGRIRSRFRPT